MKLRILFIALLSISTNILAQNSIESILIEIEKNNTMLSAFRKSTDAEIIGNKSGIFLSNPEIEFNYLWGDPSAIGNRKDLKIIQAFDFPTAYGYKKEISDLKNIQTELEYQKQLKETLFNARLICTELIYYNALKLELNKRLKHAQNIANSMKIKFDSGETNILEYNKSKLFLLNIDKKLKSVEIEQSVLLNDLKILNGGNALEFSESEFVLQTITPDFNDWYQQAEDNNPVLSWLNQELSISQTNEKLNSAMSLPKFQTGYMSENVVGEKFQGITVGLSIPFMENKNKVKYAKAKSEALESIIYDNKLQFYNQLKSLHSKAASLQNEIKDYEQVLDSVNSSELLNKALEGGEITLINYFLEQSIYYESVNQLLDMKKEYFIVNAQLNKYVDDVN